MNETCLYRNWKNLNKHFLATLSGSEILVLFSGGKDSSVALDLLIQAASEFGFEPLVHAGAYPVHRYPFEERKRISDYWRGKGIEIRWHELAPDDAAIENSENPCKVCQEIRKKMLAGFLEKRFSRWDTLVIVTSYSLWDLVSYSLEQVLSNMLNSGEKTEKRFEETAQRFFPVLHMKEGYKIFRPLVTINDTDIQNHLEKQEIPTLTVKCKFGHLRPKRILEDYYKTAGLNFDYGKLLNFAEKSLDIPPASVYELMGKKEYLGKLF
jgi:tRNA(Ile)-lysidine synthase TilS/MesJ